VSKSNNISLGTKAWADRINAAWRGAAQEILRARADPR
jgi:hypothetical protein